NTAGSRVWLDGNARSVLNCFSLTLSGRSYDFGIDFFLISEAKVWSLLRKTRNSEIFEFLPPWHRLFPDDADRRRPEQGLTLPSLRHSRTFTPSTTSSFSRAKNLIERLPGEGADRYREYRHK